MKLREKLDKQRIQVLGNLKNKAYIQVQLVCTSDLIDAVYNNVRAPVSRGLFNIRVGAASLTRVDTK